MTRSLAKTSVVCALKNILHSDSCSQSGFTGALQRDSQFPTRKMSSVSQNDVLKCRDGKSNIRELGLLANTMPVPKEQVLSIVDTQQQDWLKKALRILSWGENHDLWTKVNQISECIPAQESAKWNSSIQEIINMNPTRVKLENLLETVLQRLAPHTQIYELWKCVAPPDVVFYRSPGVGVIFLVPISSTSRLMICYCICAGRGFGMLFINGCCILRIACGISSLGHESTVQD